MVCMAVRQANSIWKVMTQAVDYITERIEQGTRLQKLVPYDGTNEEQFLREVSQWLKNNKGLRSKIAGGGFDYLTKEEMQ